MLKSYLGTHVDGRVLIDSHLHYDFVQSLIHGLDQQLTDDGLTQTAAAEMPVNDYAYFAHMPKPTVQ